MRKIITTGHDSPTTDAAIEWLKKRGATVTECDTIAVITLPYTALVERVSQEIWYYHITFTDDTSEDYVIVTLDVDARQTDLEYFPTPPEKED